MNVLPPHVQVMFYEGFKIQLQQKVLLIPEPHLLEQAVQAYTCGLLVSFLEDGQDEETCRGTKS